MIVVMFIIGFVFGFLLNSTPNPEQIEITYSIDKNDYFYRLRALKMFLKVQLKQLNTYFNSESERDETELINSIPKYEHQIKQINNLLTNYDRIK